jgi:hypothetical protein
MEKYAKIFKDLKKSIDELESTKEVLKKKDGELAQLR